MNRIEQINKIREKLRSDSISIGSWMQIPHASIAEIMGQCGFDWVAVDMEHGAIGHHQLPDIFRALELGTALPLVRLSEGKNKECKQALDAGAGGVIVPMIETDDELRSVRDACRWPPAGTRGVGFSRANLFGENFEVYRQEAQNPLLVAMIENSKAVGNLEKILSVEGLDAIMIGPYDLSASLGVTAKFDDPVFIDAMSEILKLAEQKKIPCGIHIVAPKYEELQKRIAEGYRFIAYSIDALFLRAGAQEAFKREDI
ncbi:HpcH/HpaI aldolase family protein [Leptospira brenneri]|uniref:2,4-dihydroxyhept-2-ene-1,7-dioic acid aldolase n=1 Tax=Leptospira brenneri TaxID=2023182 RepID=A0A2M9Y1R6_9LEPT|nr:aldolase/citrate lyase family protein [Leptospira brenneri]PJZ45512.1 2,4-dihydroxyhept-2-ene-1,7-dioic acid aldolase [Leptospira brenneri]TGK92004.1 2,4-dihydroxyhept-2-ene-1,7-dioic acid aldolase [Leptospira brenneri]